MQLSLNTPSANYRICGYGKDYIQINDEKHHHNIIVTSDFLLSPWETDAVKSLSSSHIEPYLSYTPEIILLGTGETLIYPERTLTDWCQQKNISLDIMNTSAACRTFTILQAEHRRVMALLYTRN
jgi:uncharacterized protein